MLATTSIPHIIVSGLVLLWSKVRVSQLKLVTITVGVVICVASYLGYLLQLALALSALTVDSHHGRLTLMGTPDKKKHVLWKIKLIIAWYT